MSLSPSIPSGNATAPSSPPSASDTEDPSVSDDSVNPHVSSSMLAVTSTICFLVVLVAVILIIYLVRRQRRKLTANSFSPQSLGRSSSTRHRARGSRVRQNGNFGRQNSLSSTSTDESSKNNGYELDSSIVVELGLQDHQNRSRPQMERPDPPTDLPPPYDVR